MRDALQTICSICHCIYSNFRYWFTFRYSILHEWKQCKSK